MTTKQLFSQTHQGQLIIEAFSHAASKEVRDMIPIEYHEYLEHRPQIALDMITELLQWSNEAMVQQTEAVDARMGILTVCVANLRYAYEREDQWAIKLYKQLWTLLKNKLSPTTVNHPFWRLWFNLCYQERLPIPESVKLSYTQWVFDPARKTPSFQSPPDVLDILNSILEESPNMTEFDIADMFFSQSEALPPTAKAGIAIMLLKSNDPMAMDSAVLFLLHPESRVRQCVLAAMKTLFDEQPDLVLPSKSMMRLLRIRDWWPLSERKPLEQLIKLLRKRADDFFVPTPMDVLSMKASPIDGTGVQSFIFNLTRQRQYYLMGGLVKRSVGIRDIIMTDPLSRHELEALNRRMTQDSAERHTSFRHVRMGYLSSIISHHIAAGHKHGEVPEHHLLRVMECVTTDVWRAKVLNFNQALENLLNAFPKPLTDEFIHTSLKKSGSWMRDKAFVQSWFEQSETVDALVNQYSQLINGKRLIKRVPAMKAVYEAILEPKRQQWAEHFIWMALWSQSHAKPNERAWKDFTVLAKCLIDGMALSSIPLMTDVCYQTVMVSAETMTDRNTHLTCV
jgi:hypothetical protein